MSNQISKKNVPKKRVVIPKNLFLPKINMKRHLHYTQQIVRKKAKNVLRYVDYSIDEPANISDIIELMETRPRFNGLVKYVGKIVKTKGQDGYKTKYVINAQTVNDCRLALLYINAKLREAEYCGICCKIDECVFDIGFKYMRTFEYHTRYKDDIFFCGSPMIEDEYTEDIAIVCAPPKKAEDGSVEDNDIPEWMSGNYPVFINIDTVPKFIDSEDFNSDTYPLVFVLDAREEPVRSQPGAFIGFGMGIDMDELNEPSNTRNPQELLAINSFKTIYIPNAEKDELKQLFGNVSERMGMKVSRSIKFDVLVEQYGNYLNTEYDLRGIVKAIKEYKIFHETLDIPVTFKDFEAVCNPLKTERMKAAASAGKKKVKNNPWTELNALVGCNSIKSEIKRMVDYMLLDKRRREYGIKSAQLTKHSVFFGSPGTAKTTIARLAAKILAYEGIISGENFKECQKSDVVGQYVGWTAAAVDGMFKEISEAGGGVIFFDEAYTYAERDSTCFDVEAVNCIVQNLENYRDIMCIFAGYEEPMKRFVSANPGLRSRIGFTFKFDNYNAEVTYKIAQHQAKMLGFELPGGCEKIMIEYFNHLIKLQGEYYGNGRCARLLIENAGLQLASRLAQHRRKPSKAECSRLTMHDIECAVKTSLERESTFGDSKKVKIGF